ncbi:MAG: cupin fold WbuC family metalloprotein [bacterium]|jgi:cupin fold WbuC family metalloprotein
MHYNFHQDEDNAQRFLNAIEPESYIRPHRHIDPLKDEAFLILRGKGVIATFEDDGTVNEVFILDPTTGNLGVDIPAGVYHTIISLQSGSVFYEVKPGPYVATSDKNFASWAPEENSSAVPAFFSQLLHCIFSKI